MGERLAYIGKILSISSIEGADRVDKAVVVCGAGGRWTGVVQKGMREGDLCNVFLPDCLLPKIETFSFMEKHGYRVKMRRFKGVPSEVLIMPTVVPGEIGTDISDTLGCERFQKPIPEGMQGVIRGSFPPFLRKTDEPNFQGVLEQVAALQGHPYCVTEKMDGTSSTAYLMDSFFGCCSRNNDLEETDTKGFRPIIWHLARKHDLEKHMRAFGKNVAIQWETCGPKIQSNPIGLTEPEMFIFDVWLTDERRYLTSGELFTFCRGYGLPQVPLVEYGASFPYADADSLQKLAEGTYPNGKPREGIVVRSAGLLSGASERISFKVINLDYKDACVAEGRPL